ncbi:hypothetical protein NX059_001614 [Plenodomus lindquistii]|nr:hypothetical protein NX059_001614 [Plenodomus lindquistii]
MDMNASTLRNSMDIRQARDKRIHGQRRPSVGWSYRYPKKVPDRNKRVATIGLLEFWDKHPSRGALNQGRAYRNFLRSARRAKHLAKYRLLYEYSPITSQEVRLLFINPARRRDQDLHVGIKTYDDSMLGKDQEYEALSYHWGGGPTDKPVFLFPDSSLPIPVDYQPVVGAVVPDYEKGCRLYVQRNLDKALRYLRHETEVVVLWVDAICINQWDVAVEKPAQIAKMKDIYKKAHNVCVWLDNATEEGEIDRTEDFEAALEFSQNLHRLRGLGALLEDTNTTKYWSDLLDLMRSKWFSRRWVIQELALAGRATVHVGKMYVPWQDFADVIGLFSVHFDQIRRLFRQSSHDTIFRKYQNFNEIGSLTAKTLLDVITNNFRTSSNTATLEPVFDLETLVSELCFFQSSDPRDTIYALLNIANESLLPETHSHSIVKPPKVNYGQDLVEVYTDFLQWVVSSNQSIDILCRRWASPERVASAKSSSITRELPSWIQTVFSPLRTDAATDLKGHINGDSLVGKAGRQRYNASRSRNPVVQFGLRLPQKPVAQGPFRRGSAPAILGVELNPIVSEKHVLEPIRLGRPQNRLIAEGLEIGSITWASESVAGGLITRICLKKGGLRSQDSPLRKLPDKLWRTLVADRTAEGDKPPPWYSSTTRHCLTLIDNSGSLAARDLLEHGSSAGGTLPPNVTEYLERVHTVTCNRKFFEARPPVRDTDHNLGESRTAAGNSGQYFGLAPPNTNVGDRVCILYGCSVPCILRPRNFDASSLPSQSYTFVGEAYVHGQMDGEAITMLSSEGLEQRSTRFSIF